MPSLKAKVPSLQTMPASHAAVADVPDAAVSPRTSVALAAFRMYDVDGSGELDVNEFYKVCSSSKVDIVFHHKIHFGTVVSRCAVPNLVLHTWYRRAVVGVLRRPVYCASSTGVHIFRTTSPT